MAKTECPECGALIRYDSETELCAFRYRGCEIRMSDLGTVAVTPPSREVALRLGELLRMTQEPVDGPAGLSSTTARGYGCEHTGIWSWRWDQEDDWVGASSWSEQCLMAVERLRNSL